MNNYKYSREKLSFIYFIILICSYFIPEFCYADMAVGILLFPPLIIFFAFLGVWVIETLILKDRLEKNIKKASWVAFLINLISTFLGFLFGYLIFKNKLFNELTNFLISILFSIAIEGFILWHFYRETKRLRIITTIVLMNLASYVFLAAIVIVASIPVLGTAFVFIVTTFLLWKLYKLLKESAEVSRGYRLAIKYLLVFLIILFVIAIGFELFSPPPGRARAKDARIQSDMAQLKLEGEIYFDEHHSFIDFEKNSNFLKLKEDILVQGGRNFAMNIEPSGTEYCSEVKLNIGKWFCVDSAFVRQQYDNNPACSETHFSCN